MVVGAFFTVILIGLLVAILLGSLNLKHGSSVSPYSPMEARSINVTLFDDDHLTADVSGIDDESYHYIYIDELPVPTCRPPAKQAVVVSALLLWDSYLDSGISSSVPIRI
jgi:hypothetical protein